MFIDENHEDQIDQEKSFTFIERPSKRLKKNYEDAESEVDEDEEVEDSNVAYTSVNPITNIQLIQI